VLNWSNYVALGDSLTAGRDDHGPGGVRIGWARRLAGILTARTAVPCALTNLAFDGASVAVVLEHQLPSVARIRPDLVSVTVGMNDIQDPGFSRDRFAAELGRLLDGLVPTGATVLTCTLPDIAGILPLPAGLVELARLRMRLSADQLITLRYEEMVRQPAAAASALATFTGFGVAPVEAHVAGTVMEPGAWRRLLAPAQAAEVEQVAGEELRRVGYGA